MPQKKNLFLEYIYERFGEAIQKSVLRFILKNKQRVEDKLPNQYTLGYINMEDIDYKTVRIDAKADSRIDFDIVVVPELDCSIKNSRNNDYDRELVNDIWLSISCSGDIAKELKDFRIIEVNEYSPSKPQKPLADDLVPIISKADYEKYATEMLEKFYPESLESPQVINAEELAQRMNLQVIKRAIKEDRSVFGQIFFKDTEVEIYNREKQQVERVNIPQNTVIVDNETTALFSFGSENLTIAHECVHFYLHKKAFYFAQMLNKELSHIQCQTSGGMVGVDSESKNNWMEIQANGIAPYILMPKKTFLEKYRMYEKMASLIHRSKEEYIEEVIRALAEFFKVSVYAARKRLIDLGINDAEGVLNWVDGRYVKPYFYKEGSLASNETFTVSYKDVYNKVFTGGNIALLIYQGDFVLVENHLCINSSKFVEKDENGEDRLTEYARYHLDECCVKFICATDNSFIHSGNLETLCYLCRDIVKDLNFDIEISQDNAALLNSQDLPSRYNDYRSTISEIKRDISYKQLPDILKYFAENLKLDVNSLAIDTGLDERTIRRYMNGENKVPEKRTVIALCMAMKLPPDIIDIVLRQSHIALAYGNADDDALLSVISMMRGKSIKKINKYLSDIGAEPLTNKTAV